MQRRLTITIDEDVYDGLYRVAGRRKISKFIESLVRPYVLDSDLDVGYRQMADDTEREAEAMEWIESTAAEVSDEAQLNAPCYNRATITLISDAPWEVS